ncbi:MAG TPA: protein kinase [Kofleriaceae bacterium]|jgi:serine/threonine-protein kinase|nr:protein kinase [Kofleriaceae bacterium]
MAASPSPSSDDPFAIGSVLDDRYRIEAVLGSGGMGRVYRAEHTKIGKSVAIKVLHSDLTRNREASQRFQREAIASGRLDHPNIVGVSDFGVLDSGALYLVMEVLEGESLGDRLARDARIHWVEALDIMRGMLYGLRHAHERGVVHRDIKPDNVYLAQKEGAPVIKILDFGIAKLYAGSADDPASTRAGLTVGTPAYLSPEQAVGGEITPASDLYSASIVLYEMLVGRAPFEDRDPLAMLGAHVSRPAPRFADIAPGVDIPAPLEDIIQRGLRKSPSERIATAGEYLALIDAFSPPLHPRGQTSPPIVAEASGPVISAAPALSGPTLAPTLGSTTGSTTGPTRAPASAATPLPGRAATPLPAAVVALPRAARSVSLADVTEPIPLTWIVRSGVVIGLVIIAAIALAIGAHCRGRGEPAARSAASAPAAEPSGKAEAAGKPEPGKPEAGARPGSSAAAESPSKPDAGKPELGEKSDAEPQAKPETRPDTKPETRPEPPRPSAAPARPTPPKPPAGRGRPGSSAPAKRPPGH